MAAQEIEQSKGQILRLQEEVTEQDADILEYHRIIEKLREEIVELGGTPGA